MPQALNTRGYSILYILRYGYNNIIIATNTVILELLSARFVH